MAEKGTHDGHRERMREKLFKNGIDALTQAQVLEVMLYHAIPRGDVRPLAERLIKKFGSFPKVLNAPIDELLKIDGIGPKTAIMLNCMPHYTRYYFEGLEHSKSENKNRIYDICSAVERLKPRFLGLKIEWLGILFLDARGVVKYETMIEGEISQVPLYIRQVIKICIDESIDTVIISHNHPSGNPIPSKGDVIATKELQIALGGIQVNLDDHIIFTDHDYLSFKKSGWLDSVEIATHEYIKNMIITAQDAEEELEL